MAGWNGGDRATHASDGRLVISNKLPSGGVLLGKKAKDSAPMSAVDHDFGTFTTHELERLRAYKGAVAAGIYSDWDGTSDAPDTEALAWLARQPVAYPFTVEELRRLDDCKTAIAAGYYSEEVS
jgi:hypothetical protein